MIGYFSLKSPYPSLPTGSIQSYGGSQMWANSEVVRKCGCGIVAAYDLLLYLQRKSDPERFLMPGKEEYCRHLEYLRHHYFPVFYPSGINGVLLAHGINKLFRDCHLPYHAVWAVSEQKFFPRIQDMLRNDIPVIISIGPVFPLVWKKAGLNLYKTNHNGEFRKAAQTKCHFLTVTQISDQWFTVSSWGKRYSISIEEYKQYVSDHSNYILSNIVYVTEKEPSTLQ